jgi:hypothetical protein
VGDEGFDDDPPDDAQAADNTRTRKIRVEPSSFFIGTPSVVTRGHPALGKEFTGGRQMDFVGLPS